MQQKREMRLARSQEEVKINKSKKNSRFRVCNDTKESSLYTAVNLLYLIMKLIPTIFFCSVCWFNSTHKALTRGWCESGGGCGTRSRVREKRRNKKMYNNKQRRCLTPRLPSEQSSVNSLLPTIFLKPSTLFTHYTVLCSWKAAVKWNNVNNNIPQQTIFFFPSLLLNTARALRFQHRGKYTSERKNPSTHSTFSFLCVIIPFSYFFLTLECLILWHCLNLSRYFFFFIAIQIILLLPIFQSFPHSFAKKKKAGEWEKWKWDEVVCVGEWTRERSGYKSVRWRMKNTFLRPL